MKKYNILNEINKAVDSHILVIVEGKKDKKALEKIGFENIFILHGRPLYVQIEKISSEVKECIILTDFDKKGKQLYHWLKKELVKNGVRINDRLRRVILGEKVSHIEGLATFIQNQNRKKVRLIA
ncbi:MAG: toprim domain-containing protein [Candidatus Pacearchaeota archaeon]|nr:MAG: toprim domain-containing protein [Candidatus Pacearchaeota archaeon]